MADDKRIRFQCPHCGKSIQAKPELAGKQLACPNCKKMVTVPFPEKEDSPSAIPIPPPPPVVVKIVTEPTIQRRHLGKTPENWLAIFDWRFEYYLTPWIIRAIWILFLLLVACLILVNTIDLVWSMLPNLSSAKTNSDSVGPMVRTELNWPTSPSKPTWVTVRLTKILIYAASIVGSTIGILLTRMILELLIVVFRIAEDIGVLRRKYSEEVA